VLTSTDGKSCLKDQDSLSGNRTQPSCGLMPFSYVATYPRVVNRCTNKDCEATPDRTYYFDGLGLEEDIGV
jgi:hypothetical protein